MIRGYFDPLNMRPVPMVRAFVHVPALSTRWIEIEFIVDTGATDTTLHPIDALTKFGVDSVKLADPNQWTTPFTTTAAAGSPLYFEEPAEYQFHHFDGSTQTIIGQIAIAHYVPGQKHTRSLLGWDVLENFTITAHYGQKLVSLD